MNMSMDALRALPRRVVQWQVAWSLKRAGRIGRNTLRAISMPEGGDGTRVFAMAFPHRHVGQKLSLGLLKNQSSLAARPQGG